MQSRSKQNASYTPALLSIRSYVRARSGLLYRALSFYLVVAHLSMYVLPVGQLLAEPVPVPVLKSPKFESTDMDPYFEKAKQTRTASMWDSVISEGLTVLRAAWESAVELEFDTELTKVNQSDAYNETENYQDYIKKSLEMQREQAAAEWESSASSVIELRREQFLRAVSEQISEDASTESEKSLNRATTEMADLYRSLPRYSGQADYRIFSGESTLDLAELTWKRDYNQRMDQGLSEYAQGLQTIEQQYALYMGALDEGEARFETNRAIISQYEQQVRDGIDQAIWQMEQMLASNGMFYKQNGDLNPSGNELAALIASVKQKLDSGAKLSEIATEMTQYLDSQKEYAVQQEATYREAIRGDQAFSETIAGQGAATINDGRVQAVKKFLETGNADDLNTYLQSRGETRIIEGMNSADVVGSTPVTPPQTILVFWAGKWFPLTVYDKSISKGGSLASGGTFTVHSGTQYTCTEIEQVVTDSFTSQAETRCSNWTSSPIPGETYLDAFYYYFPGYTTCNLEGQYYGDCADQGTEGVIAEETVDIRMNYKFYDPAAEANANTWLGYVNQLSPFLDQWTDTILPAIETWEDQVADYDASYAAWKEDADAKRLAATETFITAYQTLLDDRKDWLSAMEEEQRSGKKGWLTAQNSFIEQKQAYYTTQDEQTRTQKNLLMTLSTSMDNAIETASNTVYGRTAATPDVGAKLGSLLSGLPKLKADFLNASSNNLPDLKHVQTATEGFQQAVVGVMNTAYTKASEEQMLSMRKQAIESMKSRLNPMDGLTDDQLFEQGIAMGFRPSAGDCNGSDAALSSCVGAQMKREAACEGGNDTVSCLATFSAKERDEILSSVKEYRDKMRYNVEELPDGSLRAVRKVPTGDAEKVGGDGTNPDDYKPIMTEQVIEIAAPSYGKMTGGGDLFGSWDYDAMNASFQESSIAYAESLQSKLTGAVELGRSADAYYQAQEKLFYQDMQGQMAYWQMLKSVLESAAQSILGGMGSQMALQSAFRGYVEGQVKSFWAEKISEATGLDVTFLSALIGAKMGGMKTGDAIKSAAYQYGMGKIADDLGVPQDLLMALVSKHEASKKRNAAFKLHPEDIASGGLTAVWRTSQYTSFGQTVLPVVETAAAVAVNVLLPGVGAGITAGYYAAKQAYAGSLAGGTTGALAGAASGAISGVTQKFGVGINANYSFENGWGGSVSLGYGDGESGLKLGASVNFQEGQGITGYGLNAGYGKDTGFGGNLSLQFAADGQYMGGNVGLSYTSKGPAGEWNSMPGFTGAGDISNTTNLGVGFGANNEFKNVSLTQSQNYNNQDNNGAYGNWGYTGGLQYNADHSVGLITGFNSSVGNAYGFGFNSFGTSVSNTITYNSDGFVSSDQSITTTITHQTIAEADQAINKRREKIKKELDEASPEERAKIEARLNEELAALDKKQSYNHNYEDKRVAAIVDMVKNKKLTEDQAKKLIDNPELAHKDPEIIAILEENGQTLKSDQGFFSEMWSDIVNGARGLVGLNDTSNGAIDSATGKFAFRTCFTKGTLVKVHPDTVNSRQIKGESYREIDQLRIGDLVLSANEHTGELSYRPVTELFVHDVKLIHRLTYKEGLTIETTWNHPFWVQDKGWTEAKDLHAGERSVTARSILKGKQPKLQTVSITSNVQPGFDDPSMLTWDDAKEGTLSVARVEEVHRADKVYNIEVEGNHTYFVTEEGVLVHNYDGISESIHEANLRRDLEAQYGKKGADDFLQGRDKARQEFLNRGIVDRIKELPEDAFNLLAIAMGGGQMYADLAEMTDNDRRKHFEDQVRSEVKRLLVEGKSPEYIMGYLEPLENAYASGQIMVDVAGMMISVLAEEQVGARIINKIAARATTTTGNATIQKLASEVSKDTKLLPVKARWTGAVQDYKKGAMSPIEHIFYRHGPDSGFDKVSKFSKNTTAQMVRSYVDEAATLTPPKKIQGGYEVIHDFRKVIGTDMEGKAATSASPA